MPATVAVKEPVLWPAAITRLAGTVTLGLLLDSVRLAPPDGAGADRVIMQVAEPGAVTVPGVQINDVGITFTVRLTVADICWLPSVAVTLAVCAALMVPVVAAKVAPVWPTATVTLEGTTSAAALLPRATTTGIVPA